ncbi:hypothetical protein N431DRAFT_546099 [Stipitochalara longipes BDJ]|nr:hypothetical protein N431DRAFT_546099 [Stipitochalara longipes BDJ]
MNNLPSKDDAGPILMWISGVLMTFIILTTSLRMFVRIRNRILGWDDGTILIAVALAITRLGFQIEQSKYGNGKHRIYLTPYQYTMINKYGWAAQILLFSAVAFLKVSICLLILRIKDTRVLRMVVCTVMAGVLFTNFGCVIILLAECKPAGFWRGATAKCWSPKIRIYSIYATIAYSVVTDMVLSLVPLVVVWKVRIPMRTKASVCGLMSLGLVATGFGIARAASLGIQTTDLSWMYCIAAIWSNIELFLGIIAANLTLSRAVYLYFFAPNHNRPANSQYTPNSDREILSPRFSCSRLRGDTVSRTNTVVECKRQREHSETQRSSNSEIELVPGIQKKTEFWVSEGEGEGEGEKV